MGKSSKPTPVKLITGLIYKELRTLKKAEAALTRRLGPVDFKSGAISFLFTDYYEKEFGKGLNRVFLSFKRLISPDTLAKIKLLSNGIEKALSSEGRRLVNIDPGYLDLARLVLASTKDYSHRIYLKKGVYSEITLLFKAGVFTELPWTYPDYKTKEYTEIFNKIRGIYAEQIKNT